jgi:hypothetical protein
MSSEPVRRFEGEPGEAVTTFSYDSRGPITFLHPASEPPAHEPTYVTSTTSVPARPVRERPGAPATPPLRHCFEFRLCGSESQEQGIALAGMAGAPWIAAIERVRVFLTGQGAAGAPASAIGGVEVHAELRAGRLVCVVELSDFTPQDLVVVQVDLAAYSIDGVP